jgi:hypothetical protein
LAPPGLGVGHTRAGARCRSLEVLPPVGRDGFTAVIDSFVVSELPLPVVRHQPKDADVRVGHDRAPPGWVNAIETAVV